MKIFSPSSTDLAVALGGARADRAEVRAGLRLGQIHRAHQLARACTPPVHRRLPARGLDEHRQGAEGFQGLPLQGLPQDQRLSLRITQNDTQWIEPHNHLSPLLHRLPHPWGMGIAAIRQGDIAGAQRKMFARFPRVDIPDEHLDKRYGPQVHRAMQTMVGAWASGLAYCWRRSRQNAALRARSRWQPWGTSAATALVPMAHKLVSVPRRMGP